MQPFYRWVLSFVCLKSFLLVTVSWYFYLYFHFSPTTAPFLAGPLADSIGRRRVLLSSALFFISSFVILILANQIWQIVLARFIQGMGVSFVLTVLSLYSAEIATAETRGAIGSFAQSLIVGKSLALIISSKTPKF